MPRQSGGFAGFLAELGRRKVVQVAVAYAAIAWLLLQVVALTVEAFEAPNWIMQALLVVLVLGLPVVIALSWIFDLTPGGIIRTAPRERSSTNHDTFSILLTLTPAQDGSFNRIFRSNAKMHCERFGALATDTGADRILARFDNANDALHCAIYLQTRLGARQPCQASLVIGESGSHDRHLVGDAVDDALQLQQHAPVGGLAVTGAFYDTILDRAGSPFRGKMSSASLEINGHEARVYMAEEAQLAEPEVQAWQRPQTPKAEAGGMWPRVIALVLLAAIGLAVWRWLPQVELPGLQTPQPSIAVLPFRDVSENEANQWLVAGLGEEVLTTIAGIGGFRVISGQRTAEFHQSGKDLSRIGDELGASHLLEGSVNRSGEQIRINLRLNSTSDGSIQWAQNYDATPRDLINVSRDIAQQVANSLRVALSDAETSRLEHPPSVSPENYTAYLEAIGFLRQPASTETLTEAQNRLSKVVSSEPGFHEALAALCRTNLRWYSLTHDTNYFNLAEQQCGTVLQSNRENVAAMNALGQLYNQKGDTQKAIEYFQRGLSLDEEDVDLRAGLAQAYRAQGDRERAEAVLKEAIQLEPGDWGLHSDLGLLYLTSGRYQDAVAAYESALALVPENASVLGNVASAYYFLGEFGEAALHWERSLAADATASAYSNVATMWYYDGSFEKAREYFQQAAELTPSDYRVWSNLADAESQIESDTESARSHYQDALALAAEQLRINPDNQEALAISAWSAANLGMASEARRRITEAEQITPDDPNILYLAATVYALLGDDDDLQRSVERSLELGFPMKIMRATPVLESKLEFLHNETT